MSKKVRARSPLRLGLAGGGTDISPYCDRYTGYVLNATIDRYAYCTIEESDNGKIQFCATDQNITLMFEANKTPLDLNGELKLHKAIYNKIIKNYNHNNPLPLTVTTHCDVPVGSGLGASSTLVVTMIKAYDEWFKLGLDDYEIAHLAYDIERNDCQLKGGRQDQYSATFGGFNFIEFYQEDKVLVNSLRIKNWIICELEASLLLYYTGDSRLSGAIIEEQSENIAKNEKKTLDAMHALKFAALKTKEALLKGDFEGFIYYLNLGYENKKQSADSVSTPAIDKAFRAAMNAGALGGKISGAGGGGFITFFVSPENREVVIQALKNQGGWVSSCHFSSKGSQSWTI